MIYGTNHCDVPYGQYSTSMQIFTFLEVVIEQYWVMAVFVITYCKTLSSHRIVGPGCLGTINAIDYPTLEVGDAHANLELGCLA